MKQSKFKFGSTLLLLICETNRFSAESFSLVPLSESTCISQELWENYFHACFLAELLHISCCAPETPGITQFPEHVTLWYSSAHLGWKWVTIRKRRFPIWMMFLRHLKTYGHQTDLGQSFGKKQYLYQQQGNEAER